MKKYLSLLLVLGVLVGGCGKRDVPQPVPIPNPNPVTGDSNAMKYTINGITDINLDQEEEKILVIGITHTGGKQEKLDLSVLGLPANVTAVFETASGIPSFATKLTLKSNKPVGGTYPIKIKGKTESDSVKELNFNLIVKAAPPPPNPLGCVDSVTGVFNATYAGSGPGAQCTIVSYGQKNKVKITGLLDYPGTVIFDLNCANNTMSCQDQTSGMFTISCNTGNFLGKSIWLFYSISDNTKVWNQMVQLTL